MYWRGGRPPPPTATPETTQTPGDVGGPAAPAHGGEQPPAPTEEVGGEVEPLTPTTPLRSSGRIAKAKLPILVIGDSMVKNVRKHVTMREEGSALKSLRGKGIEEVANEARASIDTISEGMLVLQGGGNSLRNLGPDQTARKILECVKELKSRKKRVRVAVVGVLKRPRENQGYEEMRREANRKIQKGVLKMKIDIGKSHEDYGVSFLDLDGDLPQQAYGRDGVHLNQKGEGVMCNRFLEWIRATERMHNMRQGTERQ